MLSRCVLCRCFSSLAAEAAKKYAAAQEHNGVHVDDDNNGPPLWFDDTAAEREEREAHIHSPEYRELHRPALKNQEMGLYGGEPGFEKAHRVWVDPDRPHMKHVYNQTALAHNLRYARYGYFKRDMHILDVDKLVRHARLLPTPSRLLTDFLYQRVPLPDRSCAALIRYQREQIEMLNEWERHASYQSAVEMFERMIVTNIPPVDVGVETHAEMIRCAAACGMWDDGWNVYATRAREIAADTADTSNAFTLNTSFYDALMTLCVTAGRATEGLAVLSEAMDRSLRPRVSMLDRALLLCAIGAEQDAGKCDAWASRGAELWALYDFYRLQRGAASVTAYVRVCAAVSQPTRALEVQSFADASGIGLTLECVQWILYAVRGVAGFGDFVVDLFAQLGPRGLSADFVLFTVAFMYCALHKDGELALGIHDQFFIHTNTNPTPELTLLFIQSCAQCETPQMAMLSRCEALIARLEAVGSCVDRISWIYDQFMELCAHLGAVASGFSMLKKLVSFGKPVTTRMLNSLLLANANASPPNGSLSMTEEILTLFTLLRVVPNEDSHTCLNLCMDAFGSSPAVEAFAAALAAARVEADGGVLPLDEDIPVLQDPPHKLRQLRTEWRIRPRDSILRRFGQHTKPAGKGAADVGSMLGSVIPFGRTPGERRV